MVRMGGRIDRIAPPLIRKKMGIGIARHPIPCLAAHLAQVNLGVKVGRKRVSVVARVAIQNVDRMNLVKIMLLRIGAKHIRNARVKPAAKQREDSRLFVACVIRPLLFVLEMRRIGVLVVRRVEVVRARAQTRFHDAQILIGQRDIHDKIGAHLVNERNKRFHIVRIDTFNLNLAQAFGANRIRDCAALFERARGKHNARKHLAIHRHFVRHNAANATRSDL